MDNKENQKDSKKRSLIFAVCATLAVVCVAFIAYFTLSKIKNEQESSAMTSQEQFESTPVVSSSLQTECQASAIKLSKHKKVEDLENEYKAHAENCREVYFALDNDSEFRQEGMYPDLAVDIAHFALKEDKQKAIEILNFAKSIKAWDFYLGPVSCESTHVLDAYIESIDLKNENSCIKMDDLKSKLVPELQKKNFEIFKEMISNKEVAWMGQPETDAGCPEKISNIIQVVNKLAQGNITVTDPAQAPGQGTDVTINLKSNETDRVALVFKTENECLKLKSVLVPNLEVSE